MNIISFLTLIQVIQNLQQAKKLVAESSKLHQDERKLSLELAKSLCERVLNNTKRWETSVNNILTKMPDTQAWADYYLVLGIKTEAEKILGLCKIDY
ncbi:MAG: hypothetical protein GYA34_01060 [Chloroflexi bacterium]|nr:hypothetical protein [Chloroflexota bacterium]